MARTRNLTPLFALLLLAVAALALLRPQPAASVVHGTLQSVWQLPETHPAGVLPATASPNSGMGNQGGGDKPPTTSTEPVKSLPPEVKMPAKGADRQPPALTGEMP